MAYKWQTTLYEAPDPGSSWFSCLVGELAYLLLQKLAQRSSRSEALLSIRKLTTWMDWDNIYFIFAETWKHCSISPCCYLLWVAAYVDIYEYLDCLVVILWSFVWLVVVVLCCWVDRAHFALKCSLSTSTRRKIRVYKVKGNMLPLSSRPLDLAVYTVVDSIQRWWWFLQKYSSKHPTTTTHLYFNEFWVRK